MKILVLSLLRLGDVIQQQPLLAGLRRQYPDAEIDVLVNRAALGASEIIPGVNRWIVFERDEFQQKIGIAEIPILSPVAEMTEFITQLSGQNYDVLYNFTHNRLSAYLAEGIEAKTKHGLVAEGPTFKAFDNAWLSHMNQRTLAADATPFQFTELLAGAYGIKISVPRALAKGDSIFLQPLTSDAKKNWSLKNWSQLLENLRAQYPQRSILVLGAPFEASELSRHFAPDDLFLGNLREVADRLHSAALLISGDTSIKHLAAMHGTPVLELALGSSNPARTGAYQDGAVILHAKVGCAPCPHSGRCRMMSHECAESLSETEVLRTAISMLEGLDHSAVTKPVILEETRKMGSEWVKGESDIQRLISGLDRMQWRHFLDSTQPTGVLDLELFSPATVQTARATFAAEHIELVHATERLTAQLKFVADEAMNNGFELATLTAYRQNLLGTSFRNSRLAAHLIDFVEIGQRPFAHPLAFFGAVQKAIQDLSERNRIAENILKNLTGVFQDGKLRDSSQRGLETP